MGAGNKADRYVAGPQQIELFYHQIYILLRLLVGIEQISRNQHDVHFLADSSGNNVPECGQQLLSLGDALTAQARELRPEVNVSSVQDFQHNNYLSAEVAVETFKSVMEIESLHPQWFSQPRILGSSKMPRIITAAMTATKYNPAPAAKPTPAVTQMVAAVVSPATSSSC